ncbi:hypothetical protein C1M51_02965 [Methylibium sp. Pch-M]|uniref:hypothetical protein n=1 Tax=Methylibium sp. Pch-M TaxID=2082386 RepID=UPI001012FE1F|nr:hypothetical protein [Methylibium sp. Pch-M]QAZ38466.1 hypothetical protein C1M51_02965 [Methylibium sp. Pch-M]
MTDRELLERAARAAGIDAEFHPDEAYESEGMWLKGARSPDNSAYWNPLHDDGDALRLAVALRMNLVLVTFGASARCEDAPSKWADENLSATDDPYAATRRAIVRAAAAMCPTEGGEG